MADEDHEAGNQQKARQIKPEPLREQAKHQGGHEHLQHAAQLVVGDERAAVLRALEEDGGEAVERRPGEDQREIEREIPRLGAIRRPCYPGAPVVKSHQQHERDQQQRNDDIDCTIARDRR